MKLEGTPVLLYHGIGDCTDTDSSARERKYWVTEKQFREHLDFIRGSAFRVVSLTEFAASTHRAGRQERRAVLTFDDGNSSDYKTAFPLLVSAGMRAEFFINPANVGSKGYLTWSQIRELRRAGMSVQSHGYEHVDLARLSSFEIENQIRMSKSLIQNVLGEPIQFLSVPYGRFSAKVVRAAFAAGYRRVCSSRSWPAHSSNLIVNRVAVHAGTSASTFLRLLMGDPVEYSLRRARAALLFVPKLVFSNIMHPPKRAVLLGNIQ